MEDKYPVVREEEVALLSEFKNDMTIKRLTEVLLYDEDEDVRVGAAEALGDLRDQRAIAPLLEALQDREAWVRERVVAVLGEIGGERVILSLMETLRDEEDEVKNRAAVALKKIEERLRISVTQ